MEDIGNDCYSSTPLVDREAMVESVRNIPGADPDVIATIEGLLSDDPRGFLEARRAIYLAEIQEEDRQRTAEYYAELRQQTIAGRLAAMFRRRFGKQPSAIE